MYTYTRRQNTVHIKYKENLVAHTFNLTLERKSRQRSESKVSQVYTVRLRQHRLYSKCRLHTAKEKEKRTKAKQ